jgi:hypothetical protein
MCTVIPNKPKNVVNKSSDAQLPAPSSIIVRVKSNYRKSLTQLSQHEIGR